jgi:hypothetical protein
MNSLNHLYHVSAQLVLYKRSPQFWSWPGGDSVAPQWIGSALRPCRNARGAEQSDMWQQSGLQDTVCLHSFPSHQSFNYLFVMSLLKRTVATCEGEARCLCSILVLPAIFAMCVCLENITIHKGIQFRTLHLENAFRMRCYIFKKSSELPDKHLTKRRTRSSREWAHLCKINSSFPLSRKSSLDPCKLGAGSSSVTTRGHLVPVMTLVCKVYPKY